MNERTPKLSIGLPVYNGEKYLPCTLDDLLGQDYEDFELIISSNASTDGTDEICREYASKDRRVRYSRNESNIGATPNWNRVAQLARGEFFKWAMHDDECDRTLVRRCMETFKEAPPSAALVFSKTNIIDEEGRVKLPSPDNVASDSPKPHVRLAQVVSTVVYADALWGVMRTRMLRRARPAGCIEADLVMLAELSLQGQLVQIPEFLYRLRRHERNATEMHKTAHSLMTWYDPKAAKSRIYLSHWDRVGIEYLKAVRHAPLSPADRFRCYGTILSVFNWRRLMRWSHPFRQKVGLAGWSRQSEESALQRV